MNHSISLLALFGVLSLAACDRPAVVTVPAPTPVIVPGPPGATGATGSPGAPGKPGDSTTVIVVPPAASAPSN
jgi:hypothetical protein